MLLELESLNNAVDALRRSINAAEENMAVLNGDLRDAVKAGVVQHFEVAYELSWKFIQRWLRENRSAEEADFPRTRKELFRMAAREGLISDPLPWFEFSAARNLTSHTYNRERAESTYEAARLFLAYAEELRARLETMND